MPVPTPFQLAARVTGCAETDRGTPTRSAQPEPETPPTLEVTGASVKYSHALSHLCCRKAEIACSVEGAAMTLSEIWSGPGCRCLCFSELEAVIDNIPPGTYTVVIDERGTQPNSGEPMPIRVLLTQTITVS